VSARQHLEEVMSHPPRILVAVDLEAHTDLAIDTAVTMASQAPDTSLIVLHVFEPLVQFEFDKLINVEPAQKIDAVGKRVSDALQKYGATHPGARLPNAEVHVTLGRPANEIVWAAAHFDVEAIVLASHGRRGVTRMLLGSIAEKVVRLAGCPVIVAKPKDHDPTAKAAEIEPLCPQCADVRFASRGAKLWCERHSQHHHRAHTYSSAGRVDAPSAATASTGT